MKIAHVCLSLGKGGAEKLLVDTLPLYVSNGHEITIIQLSSILEEPTYIDTVEKAGIKMISLGTGGFKNPMYIFKILKLVRKSDFDIFHVHLFPCLYYVSIVARLTKMPIMVLTEHSTLNGRRTKKMLQPFENYIYSKFDAIVAISDNVANALKNWIPDLTPKIKVINNGVNIEKFESAEAYDATYLKDHFAIGNDTIKLMMASRFSDPKDQPTIIRALQHLPDHFHAFFAGDGDDMEKSRQLAVELQLENRVHFLGFRADIPRLMKTADINILSSFYEGFSGVTLEGLASGQPFLGADVPGINDVVPNNDFLFEGGNEKALASKIIHIFENANYVILQSQIAKKHVQQYDMRTMIAKHLELYNRLLQNNSQFKS